MAERTETTEGTTEEGTQPSEPAYDIETYRHALEEARRTLNQQLEAFNDVAEKAWRIVQLNGIIATIYIAAVANALNDLRFTLLPTIIVGAGLVLMGISVYLATEGQEASRVTIGQDSDAFESVRENDPDEIVYLYKTLEDYETWIAEVHRKTKSNGETVNKSKRLLIVSVVLLTIGTVLAIGL